MSLQAEIFAVKRFAVHDGDGIRTTVFFKGCPLRCVWCHNPEGLLRGRQLSFLADKCIGCGECAAVCPKKAHRLDPGTKTHILDRALCESCGACAEACLGEALTLYGETVTVDGLLPRLLEDKDFYESSGGGVTLSGGECLIQAEFCAELLRALKEEGIGTAVDTCGFVSRNALDAVLPYTDIFLYDIKAFDEDVHIRCTGQSNRVILENLRYLDRVGAETEIRMPYVPGYNDGELESIADFLSGLSCVQKMRILPYHNYSGSKYASLAMSADFPPEIPDKTEIAAAVGYLRSRGIHAISS